MMEINLIKTEADYRAALKEIAGLMDAEYGSPEGDRLEILSLMVERYEERHYPIAPFGDPIEFLTAWLEMSGKDQSDLADLLGSRSRASEILNRRRPLTMEMVRKLSAEWHIPADLLIPQYELVST